MTTTDPAQRPLQESTNHLIIRLERTNKALLTLRDTLRSYICEPTTYTMFECYENLKRRLEGMRTANEANIQALRGHKKCPKEMLEQVHAQLSEFRELELQLLEYIGRAKMHYS